jgi:DNA-binding HxlR family transcriptional regulator
VPKYRFRKFEKSQTPLKFIIGPKDILILQDLAAYKFLDSKHILALHPEIKERSLQSRLHLLFHGGLVERPPSQFTYFQKAAHIVYSLTKKGAELVSQDMGVSDQVKQPKNMGVSFLQHSLMISNFKTILELALKENGQSKLSFWSEPKTIDVIYSGGERLPIAPDAFFTIEDKDYLMHFFLEVDRSTMALERMVKKFKGYWDWRAEGGHKRKLKISNFRVLTVALTEDRKENIRKIARKADDNQTGSEMFWFACEKAYNLENTGKILDPIWKTSKNENLHHILE